MKRVAFAAGLLAAAMIIAAPARADYAVVHFDDGACKIWWDSASVPWGAGWTKVAIALPDHATAEIALDGAITQGVCR